MKDNDDDAICASCNFPEWWADNCCETCSETMEG